MKFQVALTSLLAAAAVASPVEDLFKHKAKKSSTSSAHPSSTTKGKPTSSAHAKALPSSLASLLANTTGNASNMTNSTVAPQKQQLQVIYTGGQVAIPSTNATNTTAFSTNSTALFNTTSALNITELYSVAATINQTLADNSTKGAVVVANAKSLESLGFLTSIVLDSKKPIVISADEKMALAVANETAAWNRGPLVVSKEGLVYAGIFTPSSANAVGLPVAVIDDAKKVQWFFSPAPPALINSNSTIRVNYTNFTNTDIEFAATPLVPIVYDGGYSSSLISSLASTVQGLVVVSSGSSNSTTSTIESAQIPVVYANSGAPLTPVSSKDVPQNALSAGYLTPVKAQLLLSIAAINGVNSDEALMSIFPN
ncbi:Asparaginase / glutaminase domain profile [Nakaseomyces glabratus]